MADSADGSPPSKRPRLDDGPEAAAADNDYDDDANQSMATPGQL